MSKLFVISFFVTCCFVRMVKPSDSLHVDGTFIKWNKATISSLKNQIRLPDPEGVLYKNRLESFKALMAISDQNKANIHSIRHQFLKEISPRTNGKKEWYVIEANRSGESVELRNYLIEVCNNGDLIIDTYKHDNTKWVKNGKTNKINIRPRTNLIGTYTKYGLGFNNNDVIVTRFANNSVVASNYYLHDTLFSNSIRQILSLDEE